MAGKSSTTTSHPCCEKKHSRAMHHHRLATTNPACSLQLKSPEREPVASQGYPLGRDFSGEKIQETVAVLRDFSTVARIVFCPTIEWHGVKMEDLRTRCCLSFWDVLSMKHPILGLPVLTQIITFPIHFWPVAKICPGSSQTLADTSAPAMGLGRYMSVNVLVSSFHGGFHPQIPAWVPQIGSMMVASRRAQSKEPVPDGYLRLLRCQGSRKTLWRLLRSLQCKCGCNAEIITN